MEALSIVLIVIFIIAIAFPSFWWRRFVNREYFPKIHIPRAAFLITGVGYPEAKEEGVIAPVFALAVFNYVFALISAILITVLAVVAQMTVSDVTFIMEIMLLANIFINLVTVITCVIISKKKSKSQD